MQEKKTRKSKAVKDVDYVSPSEHTEQVLALADSMYLWLGDKHQEQDGHEETKQADKKEDTASKYEL
jgi:hypothetical protein